MNKVSLVGLKLAVISKKKKPSIVRVSNKIVYGTIIKDEDTYKVSIDKDKNGVEEDILNLTTQSFDIEGRTTVFLRDKENGKNVRIIRDEWKAKFHPGSKDKYIPFAERWIVKGYIVKEGLNKLFNFVDLVGIEGFTTINHEE